MMRNYDSDSDSEKKSCSNNKKWGGIPPGKARNKDGGFDEAHKRVIRDCFHEPILRTMKMILKVDFA